MADASQFESRCRAAVCRSCRKHGLLPVLDLGQMPPSDRFLTTAQLGQPEPFHPLELAFCPECSLVQIIETVDPSLLFGEDYVYHSSFSNALLEHSRQNAMALIETRRLGADSLVVELASNDGYMLRNFVEAGVPVLGIDPAPQPAAAAEKIGVPTMCTFFTKELADRLAGEGKQADVIIANNVLAHVADTNDFVQGIRLLVKEDGLASLEFPYVVDLISRCEFDTIYHEHLCYFSMTALDRLFRQNGLFVNDVQRLRIHGGSLRIHVGPNGNPSEAVRQMLADEAAEGVDRIDYYQRFADRVRATARSLVELIGRLRAEGHRVAAYGAAAKGTILLNYTDLGPESIEFVADRNMHKHGKFTPGKHVPICDPAELLTRRPDYVLLLVWNFKDEVLQQQKAYRDTGGEFIIPIPEPEIL
jgi:SAM-dependent methyltransferase